MNVEPIYREEKEKTSEGWGVYKDGELVLYAIFIEDIPEMYRHGGYEIHPYEW